MSRIGQHIVGLEDQGLIDTNPYKDPALALAHVFVTEAHQKAVDRIRRRKVTELRAKIAEAKQARKK